jgi:hypothetical protein
MRLVQDIESVAGIPCVNVSNVLSEDKKQQVIALGGLADPCGASNGPYISAERRSAVTCEPDSGTTVRRMGTAHGCKTGHRGDHRLYRGFGADYRPRTASKPESFRQRLRILP